MKFGISLFLVGCVTSATLFLVPHSASEEPSQEYRHAKIVSVDEAVQMLKRYGILDQFASGKLVTSVSSDIGKEYRENPIKAISEEFLYHFMMYNDGVENLSEYPYIDKALELYSRANTEQRELQAHGLAKLQDDVEALGKGMEEIVGAALLGQSPPPQETQVRILRRLPVQCLEAFAAAGVKISNFRECSENIFAVDPPDPKLLTFLYTQCGEASPDQVNVANADGWTPLMYAARYSAADACRHLIQAGANVNARNNDGWTPLMLAARYSTADACRLLIQAGAKVDEKNNDASTAFMLAACNAEHPDVCRALLDAGASVHERDKDGWTPFIWAARYSTVDVCRLLIQAGAKVDEKDNDATTVLMHAACNKEHPDVCRVLLDVGASALARNKYGSTPLTYAARYSPAAICERLIKLGADVHVKDNDGWTPLMFAAHYSTADVCRLLIQEGADVNAKTNSGWTPLMFAACYSTADVCQLLIQAGADVDARNNGRWTALSLAVFCGDDDKVDMLIENRANVRALIRFEERYVGLLNLAKKLDQKLSDSSKKESLIKDVRENYPNAKLNYQGIIKLLEETPVDTPPA